MTNLESAANAVLANAKEIAGFADFVMVRRDLIGALRSAIEPSGDSTDASRYRKLRGHGVIFDKGRPGDGGRREFGIGLDAIVDNL